MSSPVRSPRYRKPRAPAAFAAHLASRRGLARESTSLRVQEDAGNHVRPLFGPGEAMVDRRFAPSITGAQRLSAAGSLVARIHLAFRWHVSVNHRYQIHFKQRGRARSGQARRARTPALHQRLVMGWPRMLWGAGDASAGCRRAPYRSGSPMRWYDRAALVPPRRNPSHVSLVSTVICRARPCSQEAVVGSVTPRGR